MWEAAEGAWIRGDREGAIGRWWRLASAGYVDAQIQLAWALDPTTSSRRANPDDPAAQVALEMYTRAAAQDDVDSLVKLGDYAFFGIQSQADRESNKNSTSSDTMKLAYQHYEAASESRMSAMAWWNLAWMYETGIGPAQVRNTSF